MIKTIKKFFTKEKTLEDKVKEKYKLSNYDISRQRAMFNYRNDVNKYKTNDEFLNYILVFGLFNDYSKENINSSLGGFNSYNPYNSSTNSSNETCCSSNSD